MKVLDLFLELTNRKTACNLNRQVKLQLLQHFGKVLEVGNKGCWKTALILNRQVKLKLRFNWHP
ncbi:TPA: hypothetical protein ACGOTT_001062 [Streptococcus suis]